MASSANTPYAPQSPSDGAADHSIPLKIPVPSLPLLPIPADASPTPSIPAPAYDKPTDITNVDVNNPPSDPIFNGAELRSGTRTRTKSAALESFFRAFFYVERSPTPTAPKSSCAP